MHVLFGNCPPSVVAVADATRPSRTEHQLPDRPTPRVDTSERGRHRDLAMSNGRKTTVGGTAPTLDAIGRAFRAHHDHFDDVSGEEAISQLEDERGIRRQYSGRVLHELLQNALDRATSEVRVRIVERPERTDEYALIVANDGPEVAVSRDYNYENPPEVREEKRPDFNALCSVHTSNKSPDESVGNKGIGFRSVFSISEHVRVWSRVTDAPGWWGMEMHLPLDGGRWARRLERPVVEAGHREFLGDDTVRIASTTERPSFYFPLPLYSERQPALLEGVSALTTAVVIPVDGDTVERLEDTVEAFRTNHLYFVGLFDDRRNLTVQFDTTRATFTRSTWPETDREPTRTVSHWRSAALHSEALDADHEVSKPCAAIAWPVDRIEGGAAPDSEKTVPPGGVYGYLPTRVESPFGIDIQGDFQLRIDRTSMRLDDGPVGTYNEQLLQAAAEIHLLEVLRELDFDDETLEWRHIDPAAVDTTAVDTEREQPRADLWRLLNPNIGQSDAADVVVDHVADLLFPGGDTESADYYDRWARLAQQYFTADRSFEEWTYHQFWQATVEWVTQRCPWSRNSDTWRDMAVALCDAIRERAVPVVPVETSTAGRETQLAAVPLPETGGGGVPQSTERHDRTVFRQKPDDELPALPEALRRANRVVTGFQFPSELAERSPKPLGTRPFKRWEVLSELRQIPNTRSGWSPTPLAADPEDAARLQRGLIRYAADLYLYEPPGTSATAAASTGFEHGWRVLETSTVGPSAYRAGRSLATLYLPTVDGMWEPARQLTRAEVDDERLGCLPSELDTDAFLRFLGVAPDAEGGPRLTLIEGGAEGRVEPRAVPPRLTAARTTWSNVSLGVLPNDPDDTWNPVEWRDRIRDAWDEWLAELVTAERNSRAEEDAKPRTTLVEPLATRTWYPLDVTESMASSPGALPRTERAAAPRELTLLANTQRGFPAVLYSVDDRTRDAELLRAFGAIPGIDRGDLGAASAEPAFRLIGQLRKLDLRTVAADTTARQALVNLFDRVLGAIVRADHEEHDLTNLWLLGYAGSDEGSVALTDRELEWIQYGTDEVWIVARSEDREIMRRFFPTVPLVAATVGPRTLERYQPLADRGVTIDRAIEHAPLSAETDSDLEASLERRLEGVVPVLLGVAEATLQADIDGVSAVDRWRQHAFEHVDSVWVAYHASVDDRSLDPVRWLDDQADVALFEERDRLRVLFDTPRNTTERLPPLAEFGEALSELLLGERRQDAGSLFARILSEYDDADGEARLDRFVSRRDAEPLVESYERRLNPIDEADATDLIEKTRHALATLDLDLAADFERVSRLPKLGPEDVRTLDPEARVSEAEIADAFDELDLSAEQDPFAPTFRCRGRHYANWRSWLESTDDRLLPYLAHCCRSAEGGEIDADEVRRRLDSAAEEACVYVDFDPERLVIEWLDERPGIEDPPSDISALLAAARQFAPRYKPVETAAATTDDRGWTTEEAPKPTPVDDDGWTFDADDAAKTMRQRGTVGREAEVAFRHQVVRETSEHLRAARERGRLADAKDELLAPFASGATREAVARGLDAWERDEDREALAEGLHISTVWDGAGYDLLGLTEQDGEMTAVRYEVKALPSDGETVTVHLSNNELSVFRDVCLEPDAMSDRRYRGEWCLVGVEPEGEAVDLTDRLAALPAVLDPVREKGFDHDGLVMYVDRGGRS